MSRRASNKRVKFSEVPSGCHFTFKPGEINLRLIFRGACVPSLLKGAYILIDFYGRVAGVRDVGVYVYIFEED